VIAGVERGLTMLSPLLATMLAGLGTVPQPTVYKTRHDPGTSVRHAPAVLG
jgi:hypothetical protein